MKPVILYQGEVVNLLAAAGLPRLAFDLQDERYAMPDWEWFFNVGMPAFKAQSVDPLPNVFDCNAIAADLNLFMRKCLRKLNIAAAPTVLPMRYMPDVFPWGTKNEQWTKHVNNACLLGDRRVAFIEPQLAHGWLYEPSEMDRGTVDRVSD